MWKSQRAICLKSTHMTWSHMTSITRPHEFHWSAITRFTFYPFPPLFSTIAKLKHQNHTPLTLSQIFQDISADYTQKTVTIKPFIHSASLQAASMHPCKHIVFAGPVRWTGKKTKIELNPTAKDQTTSCGCTNSDFFWLPVAMFVKKLENWKNWSFVMSCVGPYSHTFFPNCQSLNHKKQSRIGWDIAKNIFVRNSNVCPFHFRHISTKS